MLELKPRVSIYFQSIGAAAIDFAKQLRFSCLLNSPVNLHPAPWTHRFFPAYSSALQKRSEAPQCSSMDPAGITFSIRNQNRGAGNTWHLVHNPVPLICIFFWMAKTQQLQCKNNLMNAKSSKGRCVPQAISLIFVGRKLGMMSIDVKLKVTFLIYLAYIVGAMYRCCMIRMANGIRVWSGHQSFAGLLSKPHLLPLSTEIMQWSRTFIPTLKYGDLHNPNIWTVDAPQLVFNVC